MNRLSAVILVVLLSGSAVSGQTQAATGSSQPITLSREALRRVVAQVGPQAMNPTTGSWARVRKLGPGVQIQLQTDSRALAPAMILATDDGSLWVVIYDQLSSSDARRLRERAPGLAERARKTLATGESFTIEGVRLDASGVFIDNRRVGAAYQIGRDEVVQVQGRMRKPSRRGFVIGAAVGAGLGLLFGAAGSLSGVDGGWPPSVALTAGPAIGALALGGVGYNMTHGDGVIYHR